jgi:hypothetical protein
MPEADAACRAWADRLVLSFLTPSGGFVHPSQMVETLAAALRSAEKSAAREMRERAAQVAWAAVADPVAAAIRSLEV